MSSVLLCLFVHFSRNFGSKFGPNIDDPNMTLHQCKMYCRHCEEAPT
jgi:hypothetical protein